MGNEKKDKTIIRTRKNRENPYVMVDKYGINDERLSLKAKGLLITLLSRPDDWQFYMNELAKTCKDGIDSIRTALNELRKFNYVEMERVRNEKGQLKHTEYIVYERPIENEKLEIPCDSKDEARTGKSNLGEKPRMGKSNPGESNLGESYFGQTYSGESNATNKRSLLNNELTKNDDDDLNKKTRAREKEENNISAEDYAWNKDTVALTLQIEGVPGEMIAEVLEQMKPDDFFPADVVRMSVQAYRDKLQRGERVSAPGPWFIKTLRTAKTAMIGQASMQSVHNSRMEGIEDTKTLPGSFPFYNWLEGEE
jgi:hypothetical protein